MPDEGLAQQASDFYILSARDGKSRAAVETYVGDTYVQHNHRVPDGPAGFQKRYHDMSHDYGYRDVAVIRSFAGEDTAVLHTVEDRGDGGVWVALVLLRFSGDKIIEQWDNIVEVSDFRAGIDLTSGPAMTSTLETTETTAHQARSTIQAFIDGSPMNAAGAFDHRKFRHHDNGAAERTFAAEWFENRADISLTTIHQVVAQHNFALVLSEGVFSEGVLSDGPSAGTHSAFADLFRCEQGLIVEHWGVSEAIVSPLDAANQNGKF